MDGEKGLVGHKPLPTSSEATQNPAHGGSQRIQFTPTVRPDRTRHTSEDEGVSAFAARGRRRPLIPWVISEKEKNLRKRAEEEEKNVNIDEHLLSHQDVAERYKTKINMEKPGESMGLTSQQAEQLLHEHGPNVLTPPKRRHPFLKFLDCLRSLFNLLLILAGILEYILLGIDYRHNFQNVSVMSMSFLTKYLAFVCAFAHSASRLIWGPS
jgi:sodium/potassium-transporting ATPase subunit alpha